MNISRFRTKLLVLFTSLTVLVSPVLSAHAQNVDAVNAGINASNTAFGGISMSKDVEGYIKEYVLNGIAVSLAQALSTKMTNSIVNWANGGFKGSPSFVNDFEQLFNKSANNEGNFFLTEIQALQQQNPFAGSIARQLAENGRNGQFGDVFQFTLDQAIGPNWQTFTDGDFNAGGWNGWLALTEPQNNPFGLQMLTENELARRVESQAQAKRQEVTAGGGFLGVKKCIAHGGASQRPVTTEVSNPNYDPNLDYFENVANGNEAFIETTVMESIPDNERTCAQYETQTPAATLKSQLDSALNVPQERLTAADEFKEILSATLTNLVSGLVGVGVQKLKNELNGIATADENQSQDPNDPNSTYVATNNQFNWTDAGAEVDRINESVIIYNEAGVKVPNTMPNPSWGNIPQAEQTADTQYQFNRIEAAIYYGEQEIETLKESIIITQNLPGVLLTLDQCIPGPDFGYQSRLKRVIDRETQSLIRRFDKAEGQNAMIVRGLDLEAAMVNANISLEMLDPSKNIPIAPEAIAFISSAKAYNQKSGELRDQLNNIQKTLTSLRILDARWKAAEAANDQTELLSAISAFKNLDATISKPETLEIARTDRDRFQSNIDRSRVLTTTCEQQKQDPKIVTTYAGSNIMSSVNIINADNNKVLYCSVEPYKVNEVIRWISGDNLRSGGGTGGFIGGEPAALEVIQEHNPNLHNENSQITDLEIDNVTDTDDLDLDHPLNQIRVSGPTRQFNLFEFGAKCDSFYRSSLIDYQNEYTQF